MHTNRWIAGVVVSIALLFGTPGLLIAGISLTPVWQAPSDGYPTGVAWADIDGNGWPDLVVTNGLDAGFASNVVYFNVNGEIETTPGWTSADTLSSGNLFVGDLDRDGDPDLVNANMGHQPTGRAPQPHTIYFNDRGLHPTPDWESAPSNAFSLSVGDPDNDGDLDVAFGQGFSAVDPAETKYERSVIYFNEGGSFSSTPGWQSDSSYVAVDIAFGDVDNDGDHDLALTGRGMGLAIFYNHEGTLETTPSWQTKEFLGGRQMAFGDVDADGYPELAVCAVTEYGKGGGQFILLKNSDGVLEKSPSWSCDAYVEPSAVVWADADGDGDLDLAGGGWNTHVGIFENAGGILTDTYVWLHTPGWLQQLAWGDFDRSGLEPAHREFACDGNRSLFYMGVQALHELLGVEVNGVPLSLDEYCCNLAEGWISLSEAPAPGSVLAIRYIRSRNLDLAVTTINRVRVYKNIPQVIPGNVRVLVLLDDDFGANFNFSVWHSLLGPLDNSIRRHFDRYGWDTTIAGLSMRADSCSVSGAPFGSRSVDVDTLLSEIDDVSSFDCLVIAPGRDHSNIMDSQAALSLIRSAVDEGLVVSAWCRGVRVLAAADAIRGRRVTGHADYRSEYEAAGASYLGNDRPPVTDGNIVTSVRSRYYRTETCEAIAEAIAANRRSFGD